MPAYILRIGLLLAIALASQSVVAVERWYTTEQVEQGKPLFAQHCAACHGPRGASTPDWRKRDADGFYPPPPLNGTAHTWHHPMKVLRRTISLGGKPVGGRMPHFRDTLSVSEIDAIIAWFQSLWSDDIYQRWLEMNNRS